MERGILRLPLAGGEENTAGWRRAQLSVLISHTGQPTPPSIPSVPLRAPNSSACRLLQPQQTHWKLMHIVYIHSSWHSLESHKQFIVLFQVGLWLEFAMHFSPKCMHIMIYLYSGVTIPKSYNIFVYSSVFYYPVYFFINHLVKTESLWIFLLECTKGFQGRSVICCNKLTSLCLFFHQMCPFLVHCFVKKSLF